MSVGSELLSREGNVYIAGPDPGDQRQGLSVVSVYARTPRHVFLFFQSINSPAKWTVIYHTAPPSFDSFDSFGNHGFNPNLYTNISFSEQTLLFIDTGTHTPVYIHICSC